MSFDIHGEGYLAPRTMFQIDSLYAWKHDKYFPPVVAEINTTSVCNQKCRYCYSHGRTNGKMEEDTLLGLLPKLSDAGVKAAVFQGTGEPFMNKALPAAIENGADTDISISITTNGVLFTPTIQKRILQNLAYLKFSVLDDDPGRYAYYHGCDEKQWEVAINNIKHAVELRKRENIDVFFLSTVYLFDQNFHDAYRIVKFLKDLGIDYVSVQEAVFNEYSITGPEPLASDSFSELEIAAMTKKVLSLKDDQFHVRVRFPVTDSTFTHGRDNTCWEDNWCQGIKFNTLINSDGEVYPCFRYWGDKEFSYGNIMQQDFADIWKADRRQEIVKYTNCTAPKSDECSVCNVTKINDILSDYQKASQKKWKNFLI